MKASALRFQKPAMNVLFFVYQLVIEFSCITKYSNSSGLTKTMGLSFPHVIRNPRQFRANAVAPWCHHDSVSFWLFSLLKFLFHVPSMASGAPAIMLCPCARQEKRGGQRAKGKNQTICVSEGFLRSITH